MRELTVGANDAGQRLDKFLSKALVNFPPSLLYKSIRTKKIKVNRHRAEGKQVLLAGDRLQLFIADEFFPDTDREEIAPLLHLRPNLSIVYEDENVLLLNKRPGVLVHEDENGEGDTLLRHVQAYLLQKGEYKPKEENAFAPALCNRIDRNTGGIVIAAKNAEALRVMNEKIRLREVEKFYLCAVHGVPSPKEATLEGFLIKNEKDNTVAVYDKRPRGEAKTIRTHYRVLREKDGLSLLEVALLTGRTHQIRAHLSHIGHPLLGDGKYGQNRDDRHEGYKHQALYSYRLRFSFSNEECALSYLSGKEFSIPMEEIYFVRLFTE